MTGNAVFATRCKGGGRHVNVSGARFIEGHGAARVNRRQLRQRAREDLTGCLGSDGEGRCCRAPAKTVAVTPINVTLVNWLLTDDGRLAAVVSMLTLAGMPTLAIRGGRVENDSTHIPLSSYNVV